MVKSKHSKNRVVSSIAITLEQKAWIDANNLSLSDLVQKMLSARMNGIYDDNREAAMDVLWERFRRLCTWPNPRTFSDVQSWLSSPGWADELKSVAMTPHGFLAYVRRRVELDANSPRELFIAVGLEKCKEGPKPTDEQIEEEKRQFMAQGQVSKGLKVVREADDARPVAGIEGELYAKEHKR